MSVLRNVFVYIFAILLLLVFVFRSSLHTHFPTQHGARSSHAYTRQSPQEQAGNATLGFEKILTVAYSRNSWRTRGLLAAARKTNLDVEVPEQPYVSEEEVTDFLTHSPEAYKRERGSAKVWMVHRDMLKYIVMSGTQTALILEDDADWDVNIHYQMQLLSTAIRNLTNASADDRSPYGSKWDVIWLGHSGDQSFNTATPHVEYTDPTTFPFQSYAWWTKTFLEQYNKAGHRSVQWPIEPTGLIAYAVNVGVAQKILHHLGEGAHQAIDIEMRYLCQYHILECFITNPEIVGMYEPKAELGYVSPNNEGNGLGLSLQDDAFEKEIGSTRNIKDSARCLTLFGKPCRP